MGRLRRLVTLDRPGAGRPVLVGDRKTEAACLPPPPPPKTVVDTDDKKTLDGAAVTSSRVPRLTPARPRTVLVLCLEKVPLERSPAVRVGRGVPVALVVRPVPMERPFVVTVVPLVILPVPHIAFPGLDRRQEVAREEGPQTPA